MAGSELGDGTNSRSEISPVSVSRTAVEARYAPLHVHNLRFSPKNPWYYHIIFGIVALCCGPIVFYRSLPEGTHFILMSSGFALAVATAIWDFWTRMACHARTGTIRIDESALVLPCGKQGETPVLCRWKDLLYVKEAESDSQSIVFKFNSASWDEHASTVAAWWGSGGEIVLDMRAFATEDRSRVHTAIRRYAPPGRVDASLRKQVAVVETSYTQLWLQALDASPRRFENSILTPGTLLDDHRYEIISQLASGGQATTYEAFDHGVDRSPDSQQRVVLKEFIVPAHASRNAVNDMFMDIEAVTQMLKRLESKHVVKLDRVFYEDLRVCQVLEYIDGKSLWSLVKESGRLPESQVIDLSLQMSVILELLHDQTPPVVHRDFTPDNLILTPDGTLKIIDFDVAMSQNRAGIASVVGKPSFVAPEQFRGQPVVASDLYSMGATMFFILTGKDPTPISVSRPMNVLPDVRPVLNDIVARLTAATADERFGSAQEVRTAISCCLVEATSQ
jgi:hypothetical protein